MPASPEITRGLALLPEPEHAAVRREAIDFLQPFIQEATLPDVQAEADAQVETLRESRDRLSLGRALMARSRRQVKRGCLEEAEADIRECRAVVGDYVTFRRFVALNLGAIQILNGDLDAARQSILRELEGPGGAGNIRPVPYSYAVLGRISLRLGERKRAVQEHAEAIQRALTLGSMMAMPMALDGVAWLAAAARHDVVASLLLGAGEMPDYFRYCHSLFDSLREREELIVRLRTQLGFHRFYSAYEEGRRLAPERAIAQALEEIACLR
jgi:predicted negative regulator of RcsB-dependent stress response